MFVRSSVLWSAVVSATRRAIALGRFARRTRLEDIVFQNKWNEWWSEQDEMGSRAEPWLRDWPVVPGTILTAITEPCGPSVRKLGYVAL